jgi:pyruvate kinase
MVKICRAVETSQYYADLPPIEFRSAEADFSNATAHAAVEAADALGVRYIVCFTESGNTARLLSRYRPRADIVAVSPNERTLHLMAVLAHVRPLPLARQKTLEEMLWAASQLLLERKLVEFGDDVVFVSGVPPGVTRATNVMKVHKIGEPIRMA